MRVIVGMCAIVRRRRRRRRCGGGVRRRGFGGLRATIDRQQRSSGSGGSESRHFDQEAAARGVLCGAAGQRFGDLVEQAHLRSSFKTGRIGMRPRSIHWLIQQF